MATTFIRVYGVVDRFTNYAFGQARVAVADEHSNIVRSAFRHAHNDQYDRYSAQVEALTAIVARLAYDGPRSVHLTGHEEFVTQLRGDISAKSPRVAELLANAEDREVSFTLGVKIDAHDSAERDMVASERSMMRNYKNRVLSGEVHGQVSLDFLAGTKA